MSSQPHKPLILTQYAREQNIPCGDPEAYVRRGAAVRRADKEKKKSRPGRPQNAFILYRTTYQRAAVHWKQQETKEEVNKQDQISSIVGASWKRESEEVRDKFRHLFALEKKCHAEAFGEVKYTPKKKATDTKGRKSLASRKRDGESARRKLSQASKAWDAHKHLRVPSRSPEPEYYLLDGPPSGEVPSLSYQGTPMTSSVSTPQPMEAQAYYHQAQVWNQMQMPPYANQQHLGPFPTINAAVGWSQQQPVYQDSGVYANCSLPNYSHHFEEAYNYPEPPAPVGATSGPLNHDYIDSSSQALVTMQGPEALEHVTMFNTARPGPVLRNTVVDGGYMNPQDLNNCVDPGMLLGNGNQENVGPGGEEEADYLSEFNQWTQEPEY